MYFTMKGKRAGLAQHHAGIASSEATPLRSRRDDAGVERAVVSGEGVWLSASIGEHQGGARRHGQRGWVKPEGLAGDIGRVDRLDAVHVGRLRPGLHDDDAIHLRWVDPAEV